MTRRTPPLGDTAGLWKAVIAAAAGRCQCRGTCGTNHEHDGGRCPAVHGAYQTKHGRGWVRLLVAPAEPDALLLPRTASPPCPNGSWPPGASTATRPPAAPPARPARRAPGPLSRTPSSTSDHREAPVAIRPVICHVAECDVCGTTYGSDSADECVVHSTTRQAAVELVHADPEWLVTTDGRVICLLADPAHQAALDALMPPAPAVVCDGQIALDF
ncbi:hypothetical protein ABZW30_28955 [Kitasatospora sp. NPDC004669]|uniref:hypothetical protein n=1 Tax=Kitasatospora sp. NPDC004669 TaxID=3154555 RepID=UPI0033B5D1F5